MTDQTPTLLVIDVQHAFVQRDEHGAERSNPQAEDNIALLLQQFRSRQLPVIHIHHHSLEPDSLFRAELPGAQVQPFAQALPAEPVYIKHANSAFINTTLESDLRAQNRNQLVLCGATGNHCVETTARMAGNLGFDTTYLHDAVWTYAATGPDGASHSAEQVLSMSMCNLDGEFASVISTQAAMQRLFS